MQLSSIEYNAIMMAINDGKNKCEAGEMLDGYDENFEGYTNESLLEALKSVEDRIINANIPR